MKGTVIAFPVHRSSSEVRRLARNLSCFQGNAANRYWRAEMRALAERLKASGLNGDEVTNEAVRLTTAVQIELCNIWADEMTRSQGG